MMMKFGLFYDWSRLHDKERLAFYRSWRTSIRSFELIFLGLTTISSASFASSSTARRMITAGAMTRTGWERKQSARAEQERTMEGEGVIFWFQRMGGLLVVLFSARFPIRSKHFSSISHFETALDKCAQATVSAPQHDGPLDPLFYDF
jgi:hypothetical protein